MADNADRERALTGQIRKYTDGRFADSSLSRRFVAPISVGDQIAHLTAEVKAASALGSVTMPIWSLSGTSMTGTSGRTRLISGAKRSAMLRLQSLRDRADASLGVIASVLLGALLIWVTPRRPSSRRRFAKCKAALPQSCGKEFLSDDFDHALADIFAGEKPYQGCGQILEAVDNILAHLKLAALDPSLEICQRFLTLGDEVHHQEALHG
jgi:hypothetical protein